MHHTPPGDFTLRLRAGGWSELRRMTNTESDGALANVIKMDRTTVYRIMTGATEPSTKFVAHTLAAFKFASFDRLFAWAEK